MLQPTDTRRFHGCWMALLVLGVLTTPAQGQIGGTTDILTGLVLGPDSQPMAGVTIEALSLETQITRTTTSDARGRYTLLFPDGGGQYRMTAKFIGMSPRQFSLVRYADEDRLVWDVQMSDQPIRLTDVEVRAFLTPVRIPDRPTPGSVERSLTAAQIANLPIDADDLNLLATLVPGVVGIDATDSTAAAFSVAGLRDDANAITLDGMTFGTGQVPQEGLRNTRIVTSTYDVSRGRFSGGLISAVTRTGTNRVQGSLNYSLRDDDLAFQTGEASPFTSGFTQNQISGGLGGPLVSNRLFVYGSVQGRLRTDPLTSLTGATPLDLQRLGISPDSISRFTSIADGFGVLGGVPTDTRSDENVSGLVRFDYLISNNHTLTVRGDWQRSNQDPSRSSRLGLPETGGVSTSSGNGV
ncbi:MAG: carboxypeptidase regulatory-like domain-containing protein, partial [Gemmatimonadales bacterium]